MDKSPGLGAALTFAVCLLLALIVTASVVLLVQASAPSVPAATEYGSPVFPAARAAATRPPVSPRPTGAPIPAPTAGPSATPTPTRTPAPTATPSPTPELHATPPPLRTPPPTRTPPATASPSPTATPPPTATQLPTARPPAPTAIPLTPTALPVLVPQPTHPAKPGPLPDLAEVPIFLYHYVEELPEGSDQVRQNLTVSPAIFAAQLQYLVDNGYQTITLEELYRYLFEGQSLPPKPVLLTFDDGYRDAYEVVFPLLQERGFVGTFFLYTAAVEAEDPSYLNWTMVRAMGWSGMEMAAHGQDHISMVGQSYEFLVYEMLGSKEILESHLGRPVRFFCYPYGGYDVEAIAVLQSAGYWGAVTTYPSRFHVRGGLYELGRYRIGSSTGLEGFVALLEGR